MGAKLTDYPALHQLLKSSPEANRQFNEFVTYRSSDHSKESEEKLRDALTEIRDLKADKERLTALLKTVVEFVDNVGATIEPQVSLSPYKQDTSDRKTYSITFSHDQVRNVLAYYWSLVAASMEKEFSDGGELDWESVLSRPFKLPPRRNV